jgi:ATP-dependent DNA helicase RecG
MTPSQLQSLIAQGESQTLEFKQSHEKLNKDVFESICAFLNRKGGSLVLGVKDDGSLVGLHPDKVDKIKKELANGLNNPQVLSPTFDLMAETVIVDDKPLLYINVPESSQVHQSRGNIFDRHEDGDFKITHQTEKIAQLYQRKQSTFTENKIYPYITLADLREDLIQRARQRIKNFFPNHPWINMTSLEMLRSARLYQKDYQTGVEGFTLAAVLLLGSDEVIQSILTHYRIDAILRVKNTDRYDDRLDIRTNLLDAYDLLMGFVEKHLPDPFYLEGDLRVSLRTKIFREAIANVLVHREYTQASPTRMIIEKDRVVFENPNRPFHFGQIDPNAFAPHPKNPLILKFFREISLAEELGSGVKNTYKYSPLYAPGRNPQFFEDSLFKTIIPIPLFQTDPVNPATDPVNPATDPVNPATDPVNPATDPVNPATDPVNPATDPVNPATDPVKGDRLDLQNKIQPYLEPLLRRQDYKQKLLSLMQAIASQEGLKSHNYALTIKSSLKSTKRYLQELKDLGLVEFIGTPKTGGYYLSTQFKKDIKHD